MNKLINPVLFLITSFCHPFAYAESINVQDCQGDLQLNSQAEVDAFTCTEVAGSLTISGSDITNVNSLSSLRKVGGSVYIVNNPNLVTLDGLSAIDTIGGGLSIADNPALLDMPGFSSLQVIQNGNILGISNNSNLSSISGFNKMTYAGPIEINNNPKLVSITGFNSLITTDNFIRNAPGTLSIRDNETLATLEGFAVLRIIADLRIVNNKSLITLEGFPSLTGVIGFLEISNNEALKFINGFNKLTSIGTFTRFYPNGGLQIINNPSLETFDGLSSLKSVGGDQIQVAVSNNAALKNIDGLSSLFYIYGVFSRSLTISHNAALEDIDGLAALRTSSSILSIGILSNPSLIHCDGLLPYFASLGFEEALRQADQGIINVSDNGAGCTVEEIINGGPGEQICEGDVTLNSQAEVDAFNCSKVTGNLIVSGADITDLKGLSFLTQVYGNLRIENANVIDLNNLSLLDSIGGGLFLLNNTSLTSIEGLSFLKSVGTDIRIDNIAITHLSGLPYLAEIINGSLFISNNRSLVEIGELSIRSIKEGVEISNNDNLARIDGFNTLNKLGWLNVSNNPKLTAIVGFNSIEIIESTSGSPFAPTGIVIADNDALTNVQGFQFLSTIGSTTITGNNQLAGLDGFSRVSRIEGVLTISDNSSLKGIHGFNKLVSIVGISRHIPRGGLVIENNPLLEGFPGLSSLKEVRSDQFADLSIINNASLKNIDGLSSLTTFFALHADKTLNIRNNAVLENIDGLSSIVDVTQGEGDTYINVTENPMLTRCCGLQPLLDALSFGGTLPSTVHIDISQNGGGCTLDDILACGSQRILGFSLINHKTHTVIQNFEDETTIDLADPRFSNLMLQANTSPQQVGSVEFIFDGHIRHTENGFPYQFILPQFTPGTHTASAEVYSKHQKKGEKGIGRTATFKVINSAVVIALNVVNHAGQLVMSLQNGDKINIKDPAFKNFRFSAYTVPDRVGKVEFLLNNRLAAVEYGFPYELIGNSSPGDYTLEAIPYIRIKGNQYVPGTSLKISFKIVSENACSSNELVTNDTSTEESLQREDERLGVTLFPVPVNDELYIKVNDTADKNLLITIRNIHGVPVYQDSYSKSQNINTLHFQPGIYYLQVSGYGGSQKVVKFIKR